MMLTDVQALVGSTLLTWLMLMTSSFLRLRVWTPAGRQLGWGNRESMPEPTPGAGGAERAAKNMLENLVVFIAVVAAARFAGAPEDKVALGATLFFWGRLGYFLVYLAGIAYVRTAMWAVGVAGLAM